MLNLFNNYFLIYQLFLINCKSKIEFNSEIDKSKRMEKITLEINKAIVY